jgi:NAD/NADP transhydrogenase beta subunit
MINLKNLLIANAVVFGICGLISILAPSIILSMWGIASDQGTLLTTQYDGVVSIAIALISWIIREDKDSKTQKAIILAMLITYIIGVIVSVAGTISGVMKTGWPVIVIFLFFATGFAYFRFFRRN